jgi:hypothetical protein
MKTLYKTILPSLFALLFLSSCEKEDEYSIPLPVIESAVISPAAFAFGDTLTLTAKLSGPEAVLLALDVNILADNRLISSQSLPAGGNSHETDAKIFIPLTENMPDGAEVKILLTLKNVLKGETSREITGLTASRVYYEKLYLVTENGEACTLVPQAGNRDKYEASGLSLPKSFRYKIAQKITDGKIDYSGLAWGDKNGKIALVDETGESAFAYTAGAEYIKEFVFDSYAFKTNLSGDRFQPDDLAPDLFDEEVSIDGEVFLQVSRSLEKNQEIAVFQELASPMVVYNPDFFERTAPGKIRFLGETGTYTLYYTPVRKNVIIGTENPAYPDYLVASGFGLGYPTKVTSEEINAVYSGKGRVTTSWGFDHILQYILFRKISDNVFQATVYTPGDHDHYAGFKPFENTNWGNEKSAGDFTFTGEPIISGENDWTIANGDTDPLVESAHHRITINLNEYTVHIEKITLP